MTGPTYGLIGRGRVATHMAHYLQLEGIPCLRWHRGIRSSPEKDLAAANVILLAINDDALEQFIEHHPFLLEKLTVHFSGCRSVTGLSGLHPLMTFGPTLYNLETYRSMPFIEEAGALPFRQAFPSLINPSFTLDRQRKPLYHALCVLAGNVSTILWAKAFADFENRLGLPRETLLPYLKQVSDNISVSGADAATGPLVRKDQETTRLDLEALAGDPFEPVLRSITEMVDQQENHQ
jgi:predicted short-subunit dehydrogenase-like oxidoreductase (DUF2520 family)